MGPPQKKQRRDFLAGMYYLAAALYWTVRLILMFMLLWYRIALLYHLRWVFSFAPALSRWNLPRGFTIMAGKW